MWCKEAQIRDKEREPACINDPAGVQEIAAHTDNHAVPVKVTEKGELTEMTGHWRAAGCTLQHGSYCSKFRRSLLS